MNPTSRQMTQHVILFRKPPGAAPERTSEVLAMLMASSDVLRQVALIRAGLRAIGERAWETLLDGYPRRRRDLGN